MIKQLAVVLLLCVAANTAATAWDAPVFKVGQMWAIKNSDIEIVVGRVEQFGSGKTAVSVSVFNVPCPPEAGCKTTVVGHAPFDSDALAGSIDKLLSTDAKPAPQFEEGYTNWKAAKGGVFTVPVSTLPKLLFQATGSTKIPDQ
jgi:hypothetical protein